MLNILYIPNKLFIPTCFEIYQIIDFWFINMPVGNTVPRCWFL